MKTATTFRPYNPDQLLLLPPNLGEWLPESHLVYFVRDVVSQLDLSKIYGSYSGEQGGQPAYNPEMMVSVLIYSYCIGMASSRKIERATYESIPFRVLTADQHPDHDTIAAFRKRHLKALMGLFVQVLQLCRKAKLIKLGHVALEQEAHERAEREKLEQSKEKGKNHHRGRPPKAPSDKPYTSRTHPGNGDNQRTHGPQTANDQRSWCLQKTQTDR